jgi:hypothetical protein
MTTVAFLIAGALAVAAIYFAIRYFAHNSMRFGGAQVITCPETGEQAMVELDTRRAALTSLIGQTDLRLESCWRWPLMEDCGQECLLQLEVAPEECRVRGVLEKWYRNKSCAFCLKPFAEIELTDHKPALLSPEGVTLEWKQIPLPEVERTIATHLPVCWNCNVAQTFRREHSELVVDRSLK